MAKTPKVAETAPAASQPRMTQRTVEIRYVPTDKQRVFHASPARYRLFGGSAGSGKSVALRWDLTLQCLSIPGWNALLLRRTFPELEQHIRSFREEVPADAYQWSESKKTATFPMRDGSVSTLRFGHLGSEADLSKYQGDEYGAIGFDELTQFTLYEWQWMVSRNRSTADGTPNMSGATNPIGPGTAWVKALWVSKRPAPGMPESQYRPGEYEFVPALLVDNPYLDLKDPDYREKLSTMPTHLRRALLEGSWDSYDGQYFDIFSPDRHVRTIQVEPWATRWIGMDYGYRHSTAILWGADLGNGRTHIYREAMISESSPEDLADLIGELSSGETIESIHLSPDAFGQRTDTLSPGDRLGDRLRDRWGLPFPEKAANARPPGWRLVYDLLAKGALTIDSSCKDLIEKIPMCAVDKDSNGDVAKFDGDDSVDCARYLIFSRLRSSRMPIDEATVEYLKAARDPNQLAMLGRYIESDRRRADAPVSWYRRLSGDRKSSPWDAMRRKM